MILKKYLLGVAALILLVFAAQAFCQSNASIGGIVSDSSGGVLPGATITVTNVATGIVRTVLTNDTGAYALPGLQVGTYKVAAELPGFQKMTKNNIELVATANMKVNFELPVAELNETVEVSIDTESVLLESNPSVGMVLPEKAVNDLPLVNSNVLDLIKVMGGVNMTDSPIWGADQTTLAGITAGQVNVSRDGVTVNDVRWATGMNSPVHLNPELVGEIKLVVAPVDAEMGRGSGQVQVITRSGANNFTGSGVWNIQNTALDAGEWYDNKQGTLTDWRNQEEYTLSLGGPVIKNKTFFFVSWNQQFSRIRQHGINPRIPTACARLGIYRYFDGYTNGYASQNATVYPSFYGTRADNLQAQIPVVDAAGNPQAFQYDWVAGVTTQRVDANGNPTAALVPSYMPNAGAVSTLQHASVFGPLLQTPETNDCSDVTLGADGLPDATWVDYGYADAFAAKNPGSVTPQFDPNRDHLDTTGYVTNFLNLVDTNPGAHSPQGFLLPNNYDTGDGLNWGGYRWTRTTDGRDNVYGLGEFPNRKQITFRIDHNFNSNHRLSGTYSWETNLGEDASPMLPVSSFGGFITRKPQQASISLTSTLKPTLLNEARFGISRTESFVNSPLNAPSTGAHLREILTPGPGDSHLFQETLNNYNIGLPILIGLDGGFNIAGGSHPYGSGRGNQGTDWGGHDGRYVYADTMTWTRGRHSFRFGGEIQRTNSWQAINGDQSFGAANMVYPGVIGGASVEAPNQGVYYSGASTGLGTTPTYNPYFPGMTGTGGNGNVNGVNQIQNMLSGSVASIGQYFYLNDPAATTYNDIQAGQDLRVTELLQSNMSMFFQDEWKATDDLSLTLGLRWEYYGVPYLNGGMTIGLADGAQSIFGYSGRDGYGSWMVVPDFTPGMATSFDMAGYAGDPATLAFIGPGSPNSDKQVYNDDYNNFGPAVGFSYQLPWFGKGKTQLRGGFQLTYSTPARADGTINFAPGVFQSYTFNGTGAGYMDLTSLNGLVPLTLPSHLVPVAANPVLPIDQRQQGMTVYDPNLRTPYVQRITMSLIRNIGSNMTLELKYIGNLSRGQSGTTNLNSVNFINNGLINVLNQARAGQNPVLLDQMLNGINLMNSGNPVGVNGQTGADMLRRYGGTSGNLANGNYAGVAGTLATLNYNKTYPGNRDADRAALELPALPDNTVYTAGSVLRYNGFPENYIYTSPQFSSANLVSNMGRANYHSMQAQFTMRATRGLYFSGTYTWSRNTGTIGSVDVRNPGDYGLLGSHRSHTLRTNGTYELPFGPNRWLFSDVNPIVGKIIGGWQLSWIHTMETGAPLSVTTINHFYNGTSPDLVGNFDPKSGYTYWADGAATGNYFANRYLEVKDPQCATIGASLQGSCTLQGLQDSVTGEMVFVNPQPGSNGNFGRNSLTTPMRWNTDMNFSKSVQFMEGKRISFRFDAKNIFNHPAPGMSTFFSSGRARIADPPDVSLAPSAFWWVPANPFGHMNEKDGSRTFQGQVRIDF